MQTAQRRKFVLLYTLPAKEETVMLCFRESAWTRRIEALGGSSKVLYLLSKHAITRIA